MLPVDPVLIHPFFSLIVEMAEKALRKGGLVLNITNAVNWTSEGDTHSLALGHVCASLWILILGKTPDLRLH